MKYQTERLEDIAQSQTLLAELFTYVGEHYDQNAQLRSEWQHLFQVWAGQTPYTKIKVFTARNDEGKIEGCVSAPVRQAVFFMSKFPDLFLCQKDF